MVSRTCLATHFIADTKLIRNIRRTRNMIFAGTREAKATGIYRYNLVDRNINSTTNLVHRTKVHTWRWFDSSDYSVRLLWMCSCSYNRVTKKPYLNLSVNPRPVVLQYKHKHLTEWYLIRRKVRFSDALLASQKNTNTKNTFA